MRDVVTPSRVSLLLLLLLALGCVTLAQPVEVAVDVGVNAASDIGSMGSINSAEVGGTTGSPAAADTNAAAASPEKKQKGRVIFDPETGTTTSLPPGVPAPTPKPKKKKITPRFKLDKYKYTDAKVMLDDYAEWHNKTVNDLKACKKRDVLVWIAAAGWGDSVNALTSSFRYALGTGRLFFIVWQSKNDPLLWSRGLRAPGFPWDWESAVERFPHCEFSKEALKEQRAFRVVDNLPPARHLSISGTIVADHPLAGSMNHLQSKHQHVIHAAHDAALQNFLLKPNKELRGWIKRVRTELKADRPKQGFGGIVGMQIRTGFADSPDPSQRPRNANFLAPGDEQLFITKFDQVFSSRYGSIPEKTRVFLMTDSPDIRKKVTETIQTKYGVKVITATEGTVAHTGPSNSVPPEGFLRMLTEWFVFKRHTDIQIITAWSLFGASAVEGKSENNIYRIDASNCGKPGAKPCQM